MSVKILTTCWPPDWQRRCSASASGRASTRASRERFGGCNYPANLTLVQYGPWCRPSPGFRLPEGREKEKVRARERRASRRPTVEVEGGRREEDVVHEEQSPLEHRQQVHQSAEALRARRAPLCRRSFKSDPDEHDGGEQISGARRRNHLGEKAFRYSLGTSITSDRSTRSQDQRVGRRADGGESTGATAMCKRTRGRWL